MNIEIPFKIYEQIDFYVQKSEVECSGLGKVIVTPTGYQVTEVTLLKQVNTATHTEIDSNAVTKAMFELRNGQGGLYFWWHSHVNMGVFWSGTDKATIEEIGVNGLCVAVVFNKKKEMRGAVWLKGSELSPNLFMDDVTTKVIHDGASDEVKAQWSKDFDEKCKTEPYLPINPLRFGAKLDSYQGNSEFDITSFEEKLLPDDKVALNALYQSIMYSFSESEVDKSLAELLAIVKRSRATKHEKKKAYKEYKELALEQKNYLKEKQDMWGNHYGN